jgi:hypothetical protein
MNQRFFAPSTTEENNFSLTEEELEILDLFIDYDDNVLAQNPSIENIFPDNFSDIECVTEVDDVEDLDLPNNQPSETKVPQQ